MPLHELAISMTLRKKPMVAQQLLGMENVSVYRFVAEHAILRLRNEIEHCVCVIFKIMKAEIKVENSVQRVI